MTTALIPGAVVQNGSTRATTLGHAVRAEFKPPPNANPNAMIFNFLTPVNHYELNLESGSYAVSGADATLLADRPLNLEPGSYSITGFDLTLVKGYTLNLEVGAYTVTGLDATFLAGRTLNLETGVYSISGADLTAVVARFINAEPGSYTVNGSDATLTYVIASAADGWWLWQRRRRTQRVLRDKR